VKEILYRNYQLLITIISLILYWLFGIIMSYVVMILTGIIVFWGKITEKIELFNFDLLIYIIYTIYSIIALLVIKIDTASLSVLIFGLTIISSYIINKRIKI